MDVSFVAGHEIWQSFTKFEVIHKSDWAISFILDHILSSIALKGVQSSWLELSFEVWLVTCELLEPLILKIDISVLVEICELITAIEEIESVLVVSQTVAENIDGVDLVWEFSERHC